MDEFELIKTYLAPLAEGFPGSFGLTDDAALIEVPAGKELVITKDAISEGVHFLGTEEASLIAKKLLRTNLSDLAAKGATPVCYFVAAMLPESIREYWVADFAKGLGEDQKQFGIYLAGGDTAKTFGTLSLSLTALGLIDKGAMLKRSGAKAGDDVYVSGTIGDAALGLMSLNGELTPTFQRDDELEQRYFLPEPRLALGQKLRGIATSSMDISDGLVQDLQHLCKASGTAAVIRCEELPLSRSAQSLVKQHPDLWERIITGGDDYELLFTAPGDAKQKLANLARNTNTAITRIGTITKGSGVTVLDATEQPVALKQAGYKHF